MRRWSADLSYLDAFLKPDQDMANLFTKESDIAGKRAIRLPPSVVPELRKKPRCVPLVSHERANLAWRDITSTKIKDPPRQVSLQAWLLYTVRYIFTGDLDDSWYAFGGLSAQLNHLSVLRHLAVTEYATLAIRYDRDLRLHLQRLARSRDSEVDFYQLLSEENNEINRQAKTEMEKNRSTKTPKTTSVTKIKGKGGNR